MHHRVLQRQMKKFGVEPDHPPRTQEAWARFLEHVDRFYHEADQDRYLLERSLSISSREMREIYEKLLEASESRVAAERNRLRAVISSLGAGLCTLDEEGRVLSINPEGERLLGCTEADVLGLPFFAWTVTSGDGQAPSGPCSLEEVMASGQPCREEDGAFVRKDGRRLPVSYTINPIIEEGILRGAVLVFFDITERKEAEQALRESEQRHRTLLNHLPVGVYRTTPEGRFIKANPATAELFGAESVEALLGWDVQDLFFDAKDRDRFVECLLRDGIVTTEFAVRRIDGQVIWVRDYARAIEDEATGAIFFDGMLLDITERKQAEEQFRQMHTELEHLFTTIPIGMCLLDTDLRYVHINKVLADFNGRPAAEHIGRTLQNMIPDIAPLVEPLYRQVLETGAPYRGIELRSGTQPEPNRVRDWLIDLYDFRSVDGVMLGVLVILQDITERKQAAEALRESEERLRAFVEALPGLALILDEEGRYVEVFTTQEQLLYAEAARLKGKLLREVLPEAAARLFLSTLRRAIDSGATQTLEYELEVLGGPRWFEGQVAPMPGPVGERRMVIWISHDITERKRAEEALRESEQRFRELFEGSPDAIFVEDFEGNVLDANPASCQLHGLTREQLIGQNVRALVP
ncbi:MAG: PAS domain S-box protein, partial [Rhodothermales bacterium]